MKTSVQHHTPKNSFHNSEIQTLPERDQEMTASQSRMTINLNILIAHKNQVDPIVLDLLYLGVTQ